MSTHHPGWTVLLIGGPSGAGKSMVARQLGLQLGIPWLQVDDLRLALQWSRVTLPSNTEALYFFLDTPQIWQLPPQRLCDGLIAVGELMTPAIEVVVDSHIATSVPIVIEGDGILPSLLTRPTMQRHLAERSLQAVFLIEPEEDEILANMLKRNRGIEERTQEELRTEARAKQLYGQWLTEEAKQRHLPVLEPRPRTTLTERIMAATRARSG